MKKTILFGFLAVIFFNTEMANAQEKRTKLLKAHEKAITEQIADNSEKKEQINTLLKYEVCNGEQDFVTGYFFDDTIVKYQNLISGTTVKDGKITATSASIDEKSATVNLDARLVSNVVYGQLNVAGQSEEGFVNIFEKGKYKRTIGIGGTINFFTQTGAAKYDCSSWYRMHNVLRNYLRCRKGTPRDTAVATYKEKIVAFINVYEGSSKLGDTLLGCEEYDTLDRKAQVFDSLKKELKTILPQEWENISPGTANRFIEGLKNNSTKIEQLATLLYDNQYIQAVDSIQKLGEWNVFKIKWFTIKGSWQQKQYQYLNTTKLDDFYTDTYVDNYFSGSISYNWLWASSIRKTNTWISPTLKIETKRDFSEDSLIHLARHKTNVIGGDSIINVEKDATLYKSIPKAKTSLSFELPLTIFFPGKNYGIDLAINTQFYPELTNLGGRVGVYLPVDLEDGNAVLIEPLLRFRDLNKVGLNFLKDQLVFGFNVSVTIPKFLRG